MTFDFHQFESDSVYFRITTPEDDLACGSAELENWDKLDAAMMMMGIESEDYDEEKFDDFLADMGLHYDTDRNGVYWDGVCCCDSIDALATYVGGWIGNLKNLEGFEVVVFTGRYLTSCYDGDVVECEKILARVDATALAQFLKKA